MRWMHPYIHACIHPSMHTCIHAYMHPSIHPSMHACIHACIHPYTHTNVHACMHASIHACIHTRHSQPEQSKSKHHHLSCICVSRDIDMRVGTRRNTYTPTMKLCPAPPLLPLHTQTHSLHTQTHSLTSDQTSPASRAITNMSCSVTRRKGDRDKGSVRER